jgi:SNF family Na+-dependent transporter
MSIELFIYLASVAGDIKAVIGLTTIAFFMVMAVYGITTAIDDGYNSEYIKNRVNIRNKLMIATFVLAVVSALLPNERTMYMMVGAHIGKEAIQSETASKIYKIIDKKLDEYTLQLEGDKK